MKQPLLQLFQSLSDSLCNLAPIIIGFFQLVVLQRAIPNLAEIDIIDIEDAVGASHQIRELSDIV